MTREMTISDSFLYLRVTSASNRHKHTQIYNEVPGHSLHRSQALCISLEAVSDFTRDAMASCGARSCCSEGYRRYRTLLCSTVPEPLSLILLNYVTLLSLLFLLQDDDDDDDDDDEENEKVLFCISSSSSSSSMSWFPYGCCCCS